MVHDLLFSVAQSNSAFSIEEMLEVSVTILKTRYGGGPKSRITYKTDEEILKSKKRSILDPGLSDDFLCLPKALLLGRASADNDVNTIKFLMYNKDILASKAEKLCETLK